MLFQCAWSAARGLALHEPDGPSGEGSGRLIDQLALFFFSRICR
jgi:hypothetical protein